MTSASSWRILFLFPLLLLPATLLAATYVKPDVDFSKYKRIAVMPLECPAGSVTGHEMADKISGEFARHGYIIAERTQLKTLLDEHEKRLTGLTDDARTALRISAVDAVVMGTVSKCECSMAQSSLQGWVNRCTVSMSLRMIDVGTGEVVWTWDVQRCEDFTTTSAILADVFGEIAAQIPHPSSIPLATARTNGSFVSTGPTNSQAKTNEWIRRSYDSLQKGCWAEAIRTASVAISLDPRAVNAYANRAWAYCERGFPEEALRDCNKALEIDPNSALAYNNRGLVYSRKGETAKALSDYERACALGLEVACENYKQIRGYSPAEKKLQAEKMVDESLVSFQKGDWDKVIEITTAALQLDPQNVAAHVNRAGAYVNKGLSKEAIEDCNLAIRVNPDYALAYNNRGSAFESLKQTDKALLEYEISCGLGCELGCANRKRLLGKQ